MKLRTGLFFAVLALLFAGCAEEHQLKLKYEYDVELAGPLFAGPNTGQLELGGLLDEALKEIEATREQIDEVRLISATVTKDGAYESGLVTDAGLTFTASDLDMVGAATLNPFPAEKNEAELKISQEADLTPFFKQESFIVLLDLGLSEDLYENYSAGLAFELDVIVKK
jgi:hypothetical protein